MIRPHIKSLSHSHSLNLSFAFSLFSSLSQSKATSLLDLAYLTTRSRITSLRFENGSPNISSTFIRLFGVLTMQVSQIKCTFSCYSNFTLLFSYSLLPLSVGPLCSFKLSQSLSHLSPSLAIVYPSRVIYLRR